MVALGLFLEWRVTNKNEDAVWLWGMSVVCEIWHRYFVSTADPEKEPPLVTANTILSILAADYPVEKLACYVSDDGGALLTFEAMAEAASFANTWVPFCRKHDIEPRNPETYFNLKRDPYKNKVRPDFVKDRRRVKREYDEFKVRINGLPDSIRRRSDAYHAREEIKAMKLQRQNRDDEAVETVKVPKATWMADGTHWPGTWMNPGSEHSKGDHAGIIQVMLKPPSDEPLQSTADDTRLIDLTDVDIRLPLLVMFPAMREGMCFMMDRGGDRICYVQFPQRFEGPSLCWNWMPLQKDALYGFDPPRSKEHHPGCCSCCFSRRKKHVSVATTPEENRALRMGDSDDEEMSLSLLPKRFGNSNFLIDSIPVAEFQGRPLADHPAVKNGRPPGALTIPRELLDASTVAEAISVISCWYEDKTEWGNRVGWIYGSVTEDVVTGYRMHNRGWKSVYCVTKRDAFRGTAPINLTDRLHQVLRWATGSVEIFFSRNNALLASPRMKLLQRVAYLNVGIYPFTSIFLIVYCFLPALSLFSGQFIVQTLNVTFLTYLLVITVTLCMLAVLEIKWSGIELEEWWRNEQFWLIGGTSAHLAAVLQGLLKVIAGIEISFTLTSKSGR
ncbi:Cellulose synthase-like protein D3 [Vitis vinifera]|uniref:Cellulose synthase-like protein D3 n=1 Tax=Vitis vinifera TaxID=29760 RepID=A0A438E254_VITVI|nr:Cellulose synthase-like protein D3 [Vitis vinifera]